MIDEYDPSEDGVPHADAELRDLLQPAGCTGPTWEYVATELARYDWAVMSARDTEPGDTLWGLTRVLYTDHARSVEAAEAVRADLREAEAALSNGRLADARLELSQAQNTLSAIAHEDGQNDLQVRLAALTAKLANDPHPSIPAPTTTR
jgi:hypothetical protein